MIRRTSFRGALLAAALTALVVLPASAHPYFQGGEAPVDSLATLTLDLAHGCDTEEAGAGELTTEVALEVPEWMRIVEVPAPDGWQVDEEVTDDGVRVEVVTWTTTEPQEPAPTFDLDVVVEGEPGDERYVGVFQACDDTSYRWVGTPDDPADDPAVRLRLVDADPDAPAPPEPEPEPEPEPDEEIEPEPADPVDEDEASDEDGAGDGAEDLAGEDAAAASDDGGMAWGAIAAIVLIVVVAGLAVARSRRSGRMPSEHR